MILSSLLHADRKKLMGELFSNGSTYQSILTAHPSVESYTVYLCDPFGVFSSIDGIFARFWTLTTYISYRFFHFIEGLVHRDVDSWCSQSFLVKTFEEDQNLASHRNPSTSEVCSPSASSYPHSGPEICEEKPLDGRDGLHVYNRPELVEANYAIQGVPRIFHGLMLPLLGIQCAWRFAIATLKCSFSCLGCTQARVHRFVSRVLRTLNGSCKDIGWLQRTPGMAPVEDGTERFLELLEDVRYGKHLLPDSFVYLLIPGLFSNHGPLYFVGTKRFFSKMGLTCHIAKIHSEASVEHNAWELKQYVEELYWGSGKRVMMLGHSKGGVDAAAALSLYWSDLEDKVAGLALVQSPYGGTPVASDMLRDGQIADRETRRIMELLICKLIKGDMQALEDLTYEKRKEFIMNHRLPENIPLISFHSEASLAPCVLAMTHIAHAELPWLPLPRLGSEESDYYAPTGCKVPVVMPVSAAMALCALHLQLRYGETSDGLVTCRDAEVPGSVVVRPNRKFDHGWMVYSSKKKSLNEADASEMCEAILTLLVEIGKKMNQEDIEKGWK